MVENTTMWGNRGSFQSKALKLVMWAHKHKFHNWNTSGIYRVSLCTVTNELQRKDKEEVERVDMCFQSSRLCYFCCIHSPILSNTCMSSCSLWWMTLLFRSYILNMAVSTLLYTALACSSKLFLNSISIDNRVLMILYHNTMVEIDEKLTINFQTLF